MLKYVLLIGFVIGTGRAATLGPPQFLVSVNAVGPGASQSETFDSVDVLTVTGSVGNGLFVPCLTASALSSPTATAEASASFGSVGVAAIPQTPLGISNCSPPNPMSGLPFTFGVPQTFELRASAQATGGLFGGEGNASASFDGIFFFDTALNPLTGVDFTLVPVPEPATWLAPAALLLIGLLGRARKRFLRRAEVS